MFKIVRTKDYLKALNKFSKDKQKKIEKIITKLAINPYAGKRLSPLYWEKRFKDKRIYYRILEDRIVVLILDISGKKDQQEKIDKLKLKFLKGSD